MRVPCLVRWPGHVPAGAVCAELAATIDVLPTFTKLAGAKRRSKHTIDGFDITPLLEGRAGAKSPHEHYFYRLDPVRSGPWKLLLKGLASPPADRSSC